VLKVYVLLMGETEAGYVVEGVVSTR